MADDEERYKISHTWGITLLRDLGHVQIYEFMLRTWAKLGLTRNEFLLLVHLASYRYNSPNGRSFPSIDTLREHLGYSRRGSIKKLLSSLEEKKMLTVQRRAGHTSEYSFRPFALAAMKQHLADVLAKQAKTTEPDPEEEALLQALTQALAGEAEGGTTVPYSEGGTTVPYSGVPQYPTEGYSSTPESDQEQMNKQTKLESAGADDDAAWLAESRLADPGDQEPLTAEEAAEMAAPGAGAEVRPETPGEPEWKAVWRKTMRHARYQPGYTIEHVILWVERFADHNHADLAIPTHKGAVADWHGGALRFLYDIAEDRSQNEPALRPFSPTETVEMAMVALDLWSWRRDRGHKYYQFEVIRPGSLVRTALALAKYLRNLPSGLMRMNGRLTLPVEKDLIAYFEQEDVNGGQSTRQVADGDRDERLRQFWTGTGDTDGPTVT